MTGPAVVPTLAAPATENQPLGRSHGASSESRASGEQISAVEQPCIAGFGREQDQLTNRDNASVSMAA